MLVALLWFGALVWGLAFLNVVLYRVLSPDVRRVDPSTIDRWPSLSIVVPARNEEKGIAAAVASFCVQDYPDLEVIVVDDGSTDRTPEILVGLAERFSNLTVLRVEGPTAGWLGKVSALETGRKAALGEWLLFVDADVEYRPGLLRRAVAVAIANRADMLVLPPHLRSAGTLEAVVMSGLYLVCVAVAPLYLVSRTRARWLFAGGGVFNLARRQALEGAGAFASLRESVVDDLALGHRVKAAGFRVVVGYAGSMITVRMYQGAAAAIRGFEKNVFPALRSAGRLTVTVPFTVGAVVNFLPYYGVARGGDALVPALAALGLMHLALGALAVVFRQPVAVVLLGPIRELAWWFIVARSWAQHTRRGVVWRGRTY